MTSRAKETLYVTSIHKPEASTSSLHGDNLKKLSTMFGKLYHKRHFLQNRKSNKNKCLCEFFSKPNPLGCTKIVDLSSSTQVLYLPLLIEGVKAFYGWIVKLRFTKNYDETHAINLALLRSDQCFPWSSEPLTSLLNNFAQPMNIPCQ